MGTGRYNYITYFQKFCGPSSHTYNRIPEHKGVVLCDGNYVPLRLRPLLRLWFLRFRARAASAFLFSILAFVAAFATFFRLPIRTSTILNTKVEFGGIAPSGVPVSPYPNSGGTTT